jgi:ribulose-5-phosphate 4-epimerase/fuculose-1-phosphate aldolase
VADAQNHGSITAGGSVLEAFDRMEVRENTAKVHLGASSLGGVTPIDGAGIRQIEAAFL